MDNLMDQDIFQLTKSGSVSKHDPANEEGRLGAVIQAAGALKKFRNLKAMVMLLQPSNITVFGRY